MKHSVSTAESKTDDSAIPNEAILNPMNADNKSIEKHIDKEVNNTDKIKYNEELQETDMDLLLLNKIEPLHGQVTWSSQDSRIQQIFELSMIYIPTLPPLMSLISPYLLSFLPSMFNIRYSPSNLMTLINKELNINLMSIFISKYSCYHFSDELYGLKHYLSFQVIDFPLHGKIKKLEMKAENLSISQQLDHNTCLYNFAYVPYTNYIGYDSFSFRLQYLNKYNSIVSSKVYVSICIHVDEDEVSITSQLDNLESGRLEINNNNNQTSSVNNDDTVNEVLAKKVVEVGQMVVKDNKNKPSTTDKLNKSVVALESNQTRTSNIKLSSRSISDRQKDKSVEASKQKKIVTINEDIQLATEEDGFYDKYYDVYMESKNPNILTFTENPLSQMRSTRRRK